MQITTIHIIWGELAVSLYRRGVIDNTVRLAHAVYDFRTQQEAGAFLFGISESRKPHDWSHVTRLPDQRSLGMPLRSRLIDAIMKGDIEEVNKMLDSGVSVETKAPNGMTALQLASQQGQDKIVEQLLERGAHPEEPSDSLNPHSSIHLAAGSNKPGADRCLDLLTERNIELDKLDRQGKTALMRAIEMTRLEAAKLLIEKGAKLEVKDDNEKNAREIFDSKFGGVIGDPTVDSVSQAFDKAQRALLESKTRAGASVQHPTMQPPNPYGSTRY